jgi:hypothetical protein
VPPGPSSCEGPVAEAGVADVVMSTPEVW